MVRVLLACVLLAGCQWVKDIESIPCTSSDHCPEGFWCPDETSLCTEGSRPADFDNDGFNGGAEGDDCDDQDPAINPGAEDLWGDDLDTNCDGIDGVDQDGDGHAVGTDGVGPDCDDLDGNINVDADDVHGDNIDRNCDGVDGVDADGDGYALGSGPGLDCNDGDPTFHPGAEDLCDGDDKDCDGVPEVDNDGDTHLGCDDCDDNDSAVYPGAVEECDAIDGDCDGLTDVYDPDVDEDGDGHMRCFGVDCNDLDPSIHPGAEEHCDGVDEDCDGGTEAEGGEEDDDGDGFLGCEDCDDGDGDVNSDATETCNGKDDDCNGLADFPSEETDDDADFSLACVDCDDSNPNTYPGAPESCDGLDNDCDGAPGAGEVDADLDGALACEDCADTDPTRYPGAPELCNGEDDDCDTVTTTDELTDADFDGWLECADCDDGDSVMYPGNTEVCDGLDNDCDGIIPPNEIDHDGDSLEGCNGDCNEFDATIGPQFTEICDGADTDCVDGPEADEVDTDGDGFLACEEDCDDDVTRYPGAPEGCDGIDTDCDGVIDAGEADIDGDGVMVCAGDCDDFEPTVFDGATELCDGLDNACAGQVPTDETDDGDNDGVVGCADCDDGDAALGAIALDGDCDGSLDSNPIVDFGNIDFVEIEAGDFEMGCTAGQQGLCDGDEAPSQSITLSRGFVLGRTEITQAQWTDFMGNNPSSNTNCDDCPVEQVNWWDALEMANTLSEDQGFLPCYALVDCTGDAGVDLACTDAEVNTPTGSVYDCDGFRLPTEAEWEYAARAGEDLLYAGSDVVGDVAWYAGNAIATQEVAELDANAWGLFDMSGNVSELVWDFYGNYPSNPATDPEGPGVGSSHIERNGSFHTVASQVRVTDRGVLLDTDQYYDVGFRLARSMLPDDDGDGVTAPSDCDDNNDTAYPGAVETCSGGVDSDCDGGILTSWQGVQITDSETLALWHFDEGSGPTAFDDSGVGNDATLEGADWTPAGVFSGGLGFDGVSGYVDTGAFLVATTEDSFTIEAWVFWEGPGLESQCVIGAATGTLSPSNKTSVAICLRTDRTAQLSLRLLEDQNATQDIESIAPFPIGRWTQLRATYSNHGVALYFDGVQVATAEFAFDGTFQTATPLLLGAVDNTLSSAASVTNFFDGRIDEVRISGVRRDPCADETGTLLDVVAHYAYDGDASDSSDNDFDQTTNGVSYDVGPISDCVLYEGTGSGLVAATGDIAIETELTVAYWSRRDDYASADFSPVVRWKNPGEADAGWTVSMNDNLPADESTQFTIQSLPSAGEIYIDPTPMDLWQHHVFSYSDTDGLALYLDSTLEDDDSSWLEGMNPSQAGFVYFGGHPSTGTLNACIDDLWLFDRAINGWERELLFHLGTLDKDGDGSELPEDCDDADPAIHPGADEECDGLDNDCDGDIDGSPLSGGPVRTWTTTGPMAIGRDNAISALMPDGSVLVGGGRSGSSGQTTSEVFDPVGGAWATTTGTMGGDHYQGAAVPIGGGALAIGGSFNMANMNLVESYDASSGFWTIEDSLGTSRRLHTATVLLSGDVLVVGGHDSSNDKLASVELYDTSAGTWSYISPLNDARSSHVAVLLDSGEVLVASGEGASATLDSAEIYDPVAQTWSSTGSLDQARGHAAAALLPSGQVLLMGGGDGLGNNLSSAELYDPSSGTWTTTGSMGTERGSPDASFIPGACTVVVTHTPRPGTTESEFYDIGTGDWYTGPLTNQQRSAISVQITLDTGEVLLAGGNYGSSGGNYVTTSEVLGP